MTPQEKQFVLDCARDCMNACIIRYGNTYDKDYYFYYAETMLQESRKRGLFEEQN